MSARRELKIEKEKKFKVEYISVFLAGIVLVAMIVGLGFAIFYNPEIEDTPPSQNQIYDDVDDIIVEEVTTCDPKVKGKLINLANKMSVKYYMTIVNEDIKEDEVEFYEEFPEYLTEDGKVPTRYTEVSIEGLGDERLFLEIRNSRNDNVDVVTPDKLTKGTYKFYTEDVGIQETYTISVKTTEEGCTEDVIRKATFTTRVFNTFSETTYCLMYPACPVCEVYVEKPIEFEEFNTKMQKFIESHPELEEQAQNNFIEAIKEFTPQPEGYGTDFIIDKDGKRVEITFWDKTVKVFKEASPYLLLSGIIIGVGLILIIILAKVRRYKL